mgnify:CR=1 FL=1
MDSVASVNAGTSAASIASAATSVNTSVLKDAQNLSQDLVNRLFSTFGVGTNFNGQG